MPRLLLFCVLSVPFVAAPGCASDVGGPGDELENETPNQHGDGSADGAASGDADGGGADGEGNDSEGDDSEGTCRSALDCDHGSGERCVMDDSAYGTCKVPENPGAAVWQMGPAGQPPPPFVDRRGGA